MPISVQLCLHVDLLLWLSVIFRHKGDHLKRPNANFISYMKQSWFIFAKLFFPCLQTTALHTLPPPAFLQPYRETGERSMDGYHSPRAPKRPATHSQIHASPLHPTHIFLQSISASSRCSTKPKHTKKKKKVKGSLFKLSSHRCFPFYFCKVGWYTFWSAVVCFVVVLYEGFFLCMKDLKMPYFAPESAAFQTLWLNKQINFLKLLHDWCVGYIYATRSVPHLCLLFFVPNGTDGPSSLPLSGMSVCWVDDMI